PPRPLGGLYHTLPQELDACPSIALALEQLQTIDMALDGAIAPRQRESCGGSCWIPGSYTSWTGRKDLISNDFFPKMLHRSRPSWKACKNKLLRKNWPLTALESNKSLVHLLPEVRLVLWPCASVHEEADCLGHVVYRALLLPGLVHLDGDP